MRTHTNNFKTKIKSFGRELDSVITYNDNGDTIELGGDKLNSITPTFTGNILKSVMKELHIDSNEDIPLETEINFQFGVKVRNENVQDYRDNYDYIDFGNYIVYKSERQEDTLSYKITCYDKMLYSMKDYEDLNITYPITVRNYINAIATYMGLTFANANSTFANYNKEIPTELYLDSQGNSLGYTFRDVLDELAEVTASTICINNNGELEVRYITNTSDAIDEEFFKDINVAFGETYGAVNTIVLSRSSGADNVYYPAVLPENPVEIKITDNQIMNGNNRAEYLPDIYTRLNGLTYSINDFSSIGICYYDLCDRYSVNIGENTYSCVMLNDEINITQGLEENIYTEAPEGEVTDYTKADSTDRKINQTYLIVDKQNQTIESVVGTVDEQNERISSITQTVNELNSKISEVTDITVSGESIIGSVSLAGVNASQPISIKIHPIADSISYLYPYSTLYPSSSLYPKNRTLKFTNTSTSEIFYWELPTDLWYINSNVYDELELSYGDGTNKIVTVTRKCQINADGTVSALATPTSETYTYPNNLELTDGDYLIELSGYNNAYLYVQLMASNIYTTQFATKVELNSEISQTAKHITLTTSDNVTSAGIDIRLYNEDGTQLDSASGNITMSGSVKFTDLSGNNDYTIINGSNITTGTISAARLDSNVITTSNLSAQTLSADQITSGTINGNNVNVTNINASNITGGTISADKINGGTVTASSINLGDGKFRVTTGGSITSTSGTIGGWTISNSKLRGSTGQSGLYGAIRPYGVQIENSSGSVLSSAGWGDVIIASTSDRRLKNNINIIDEKFEKLFDNLKPITFYFNEGIDEGKKHIGFVAQDILESGKIIDEDLAMVKEDFVTKKYQLNKQEIIALNTWQTQKLKKQVNEQQEIIKQLQERIEKLERESDK